MSESHLELNAAVAGSCELGASVDRHLRLAYGQRGLTVIVDFMVGDLSRRGVASRILMLLDFSSFSCASVVQTR